MNVYPYTEQLFETEVVAAHVKCLDSLPSHMTMDTPGATVPTEPPPKRTLFCWECDHQSPVDGDWEVETRDSTLAYICPECTTTITERPHRSSPGGGVNVDEDGSGAPRERASSDEFRPRSLVSAWGRVVTEPVRAWTATVEAAAFRNR